MPVGPVGRLEGGASYSHVTSGLAELHGDTLNKNNSNKGSGGGINSDVISLSQILSTSDVAADRPCFDRGGPRAFKTQS